MPFQFSIAAKINPVESGVYQIDKKQRF